MMFYLWLCLIKMTSPQETSKANNLQGMKNLMLPEVSSLQRGRGGREAWGGGGQRKQAEETSHVHFNV